MTLKTEASCELAGLGPGVDAASPDIHLYPGGFWNVAVFDWGEKG